MCSIFASVMDKESTILLQKIDCNCNDCKFMDRDIYKHNRSEVVHHLWQIDYFLTVRKKMVERGRFWIKKGDIEKGEKLLKEAKEMKFQYSNTSFINYGYCTKLEKDVSFIPNTCQLETQECFEHRRV